MKRSARVGRGKRARGRRHRERRRLRRRAFASTVEVLRWYGRSKWGLPRWMRGDGKIRILPPSPNAGFYEHFVHTVADDEVGAPHRCLVDHDETSCPLCEATLEHAGEIS
jgi:hypothetical protein